MPALHLGHEKKLDSFDKSETRSTSTSVFFWYDVLKLCHKSRHTFGPEMHHPAIDTLGVLTTVLESGSSYGAP